jgi:hypothetical protein
MEKIAVFKRHFRLELEDIAEAVGHDVSKDKITYIPEDFPTNDLTGCSTLIWVGASKIDAGGPTMKIPFSKVEEIAKEYGINTIYRMANFDKGIEGVRTGSRYGIK